MISFWKFTYIYVITDSYVTYFCTRHNNPLLFKLNLIKFETSRFKLNINFEIRKIFAKIIPLPNMKFNER